MSKPRGDPSFELQLGQPSSGWLPVNVAFEELEISEPASSVLNDPIDDLVGLLEGLSNPKTGDQHRVCLWLEPQGYAIDFVIEPGVTRAGPETVTVSVVS